MSGNVKQRHGVPPGQAPTNNQAPDAHAPGGMPRGDERPLAPPGAGFAVLQRLQTSRQLKQVFPQPGHSQSPGRC
jgi:hypothetical protein